MKLTQLIPILWVNDVQATINFYTEKLGFVCSNYLPDQGWAIVRRDSLAFMFALPNAHSPFSKPMFTGSFYINTDNLDELWANLKEKVTIEYPLEQFDYGMREFAIRDLNGYIIQFTQPVERNS